MQGIVRRHWTSVQEYCKSGATEFLGIRNYDPNAPIDTTGFSGSRERAANGINLLRTGKREGAELVEKYMKQVMQNLPTYSRQWTQEVAGFLPNVPAFLAGEPASMWNMHTDRSENSPLRIWVNILPSAGNTPDQIYQRGAAICALALVLQQKRSVVRIAAYADLGEHNTENGSMCSYDLSMPLSTAQLLAALADNGTRCLALEAGLRTNYHGGGWVLGHCPTQGNYSDALCKKHLGAGPDDIVVPAIHAADTLLRDPIAWIHKRLEPYMTEEVYR